MCILQNFRRHLGQTQHHILLLQTKGYGPWVFATMARINDNMTDTQTQLLCQGQAFLLTRPYRSDGDRYFFWLFVVSSGFEELLDRRSQQVDDADEGVIVSVSPGPAFGGLEDAVERLEASVAVA